MHKLSKRKQRLLQLFSSPNAKLDLEQVSYASSLIDRYPRQDVAMYVLRQYKLSILFKKSLVGVELNRNESKFLSQCIERQLDGHTGSDSSLAFEYIADFESFISQFHRYQEMSIPAIANSELIFQSPVELFSSFSDMERTWREKRKRVIHANLYGDGEMGNIIFEKDGLYVFDTQSFSSLEDGKTLRHCGNYYGDNSQRILSVRSKVDDEGLLWKPHATIVLSNCTFNIDGTIKSTRTGEIKGFGNNPPAVKYHNFIGEFLLACPFIKGMNGGCSFLKDDLQFTDFSKDLQARILKHKPYFIRSIEQFIIADGKMSPDLMEQFNETFKYDYGVEDKFVIREFGNLKDYAKAFDLSGLETLVEGSVVSDGNPNGVDSETDEAISACLKAHMDATGFEIIIDGDYHGNITIMASVESAMNSIFSIIKEQCGGALCKDKPLADTALKSPLYNSIRFSELTLRDLIESIMESIIKGKVLEDISSSSRY